jgi:ATP-binding cassette subfamily B protein
VVNELWRTLRGHRTPFVAIILIEATAASVQAALHPLLLKALFDEAVLVRDFQHLLTLGIFYLLVGVALNLGGYGIACWRKRFENSITLSLEMELLERALGLDVRLVSKAGHASYVSRVHNDVAEGVVPAIDIWVRAVRTMVSSIVFVAVLLYLSWEASLILLVIVPPLVYVSNRLAKRIQDNTDPERDAEAYYINKLTRTLEAFHALRGLPLLLPGTQTANKAALRGFLGLKYVNFRLTEKQSTLSDLVMNLSNATSMIIGAYFVFAGRMSFGSFLAFVNSLWQAVTGIFDLVDMIPQIRRSTAVLKRIDTIRSARPGPYASHGPAVMIHGARVTYGDGATVSIDDFEVRAGEHVLLRGSNGCGKTTLLHIIAGTLAPDDGAVTVPPRIASLTTPVSLPPLPVGELVSDERLQISMQVADLTGQLPSELSSGQRQRVGVAALLCQDADIYLADEPFANLDKDGRDLVLRALKQRTQGHGLLVVHHGDEELDGHFDRVVNLSAATARA